MSDLLVSISGAPAPSERGFAPGTGLQRQPAGAWRPGPLAVKEPRRRTEPPLSQDPIGLPSCVRGCGPDAWTPHPYLRAARDAPLGGRGGRLMSPSVLQRLPRRRLPRPRHSDCAQRALRGHKSPSAQGAGRKVSVWAAVGLTPALPECLRERARRPAPRLGSAEFAPSYPKGAARVPSPDPMSPPPRSPTPCETALPIRLPARCAL